MLYKNVQCVLYRRNCVCVCMCVYVCVLARVCLRRFEFRLGTDLAIFHHCFSNLKCAETRSKNHNRLKISVDRRSFKFRHPSEARNLNDI